jgi:hypothetical protein
VAKQKQPFSDYKRKGKLLQAGFNWLRERMHEEGRLLESTAWADVSMAEYLWFGLLRDVFPESTRYDVLRQLAKEWPASEEQFNVPAPFAGHTFIATGLPENARHELIARIVALGGAAALRPLLLLDHLPAREDWARSIGTQPNDDDASLLGTLVRNMSDSSRIPRQTRAGCRT